MVLSAPARGGRWVVAVLRTARPRQWPKNLLVFAAPLAGASLGRPDGLLYALVAAAAFGFASVAVYFVNDVADAGRDRLHPRKRHRPVASGELPKRDAVVLGTLCALAGLAAGLLIAEPLLTATVAAYLGLSFGYSWKFKHVPVLCAWRPASCSACWAAPPPRTCRRPAGSWRCAAWARSAWSWPSATPS
jgi:decaprenyl-phosphate phosphoribosyltransferase